MTNAAEALEQRLQVSLGTSLVGLKAVIHALAVAAIARGHVLLQGPPGMGKTLLSKCLAAALGGSYRRVQGTSDLMPSDIIGVHVYVASRGEFEFRAGPLFADVLLFDEINRASPKTQSALLEAMEERQVTVERETYPLPEKFLVIATQNPADFEGTYPLPESQLDRFMIRIDMPYPGRRDEEQILLQYSAIETAGIPAGEPLSDAEMRGARRAVDQIHAAPELMGYVLSLALASREYSHLSLGMSTRGALALLRAARVAAALRGSGFATPDDVKEVVSMVMAHRLVLAPEALLEGVTTQQVVQRLVEQVDVPR